MLDNQLEFKDLGLSEVLLQAVHAKGFEIPTPIQAMVIPKLLENKSDIVGKAQTGTGKTAAFGLPVLDRIDDNGHYVKVLILVPTRELAIQVSDEVNSFKGEKRLFIHPFYGGAPIDSQITKLRKGVDIVVGTPGRVQDLINRTALDLSKIQYLILDEADEMLNMGFKEDLENILSTANDSRRTLLFSATMPKEILSIAQSYMGKYEIVEVKQEAITTTLTDQIYFEVNHYDKFEALCRIIDFEQDFYGIIFTRTKNEADDVNTHLLDRGYDTEVLHGDITQNQREKIYNKFKKKQVNILVATDVAARGLDVQNLSHVINYSIPQDPESYVHRIGRTGRAGNEGTAITFVTPKEIHGLLQIQRISKSNIRKEKLPNVKDIIEARRGYILEQIKENIDNAEIGKDFHKLAEDLLNTLEPQQVVTALLNMSYKEFLDESIYKEINEVRSKSNRKESNYKEWRDSTPDSAGDTRLFIALGKKDGLGKKTLVDLIKETAKTHDSKINDVQVFDNYSFITVPFQEAEFIIRKFKMEGRGNRPLVEIAGDKNSPRGGEERGSRGGGERRFGGDRESRGGDRGDRRGGYDRGGDRGGRSSRDDSRGGGYDRGGDRGSSYGGGERKRRRYD
jgi:ATP-dependent RNA helicase DeaD